MTTLKDPVLTLLAGILIGYLLCMGVVTTFPQSILCTSVSSGPLPPLPSQTVAIEGGNITISGSWGVDGNSPYYSVTCEGERRYNATIYQCNFKDDPTGIVTSQAPWNRVLTTINKTGPTANAWFWPMSHGIYYPLVVLDDGTYVQFCEIRGDDL